MARCVRLGDEGVRLVDELVHDFGGPGCQREEEIQV